MADTINYGSPIDLNAANIDAQKLQMLKDKEQQEQWDKVFKMLSGYLDKKKMDKEIATAKGEGKDIKKKFQTDSSGQTTSSTEISDVSESDQYQRFLRSKMEKGGMDVNSISFGGQKYNVKAGASGLSLDPMFTPEKKALASSAIKNKGHYASNGSFKSFTDKEDASKWMDFQLGNTWGQDAPDMMEMLNQAFPAPTPPARTTPEMIRPEENAWQMLNPMNQDRWPFPLNPTNAMKAIGNEFTGFGNDLRSRMPQPASTRMPPQQAPQPNPQMTWRGRSNQSTPTQMPLQNLRMQAIKTLQENGYPLDPRNIDALMRKMSGQ